MIILKEQIDVDTLKSIYRFDDIEELKFYSKKYIKEDETKFFKYQQQFNWFENIWLKLTVPEYTENINTDTEL